MTTASKVPPPTTQPPSRPPVQPRRPPNKPDSPPVDPSTTGRASAGELLRYIDDALIGSLAIATTALPPATDRVEVCGQEILAFRLRRARAAVADLLAYSKTPARRDPSSAAVGADVIAAPGGPGQAARPRAEVRAGSLPAPGAGDLAQQIGEAFGFRLPRDVRRH